MSEEIRLGDFPTEPLLHILRYLHYTDLSSLSCVNRRLELVIADNTLWKWQCQHYFLDNKCGPNRSWKTHFIELHQQYGRYPDYCKIRRAWNQLEEYLQKNLPDLFTSLNGPVSEEELATAEEKLGHPLPLDLRVSLLIHNGQEIRSIGILGRTGTSFNEGDDILLPLSNMLDFKSTICQNGSTFEGCLPITVCYVTQCLKMIAISNHTGFEVGEVYAPSRPNDNGEQNCFIIGKSFKEWFCTYAQTLYDGKYFTTDKAILRFYKEPSYLAVTDGIRVTVATCFQSEYSTCGMNQNFLTAYQITMEMGEDVPRSMSCQLLTRHWTITDGNGDVDTVDGQGVVGEFPTMIPGSSYSWISRCGLSTQTGTMEGYFTMWKVSSGEGMFLQCPRFKLDCPPCLSPSDLRERRKQAEANVSLLGEEGAALSGN